MKFKKILCCIKGHKPFHEDDDLKILKDQHDKIAKDQAGIQAQLSSLQNTATNLSNQIAAMSTGTTATPATISITGGVLTLSGTVTTLATAVTSVGASIGTLSSRSYSGYGSQINVQTDSLRLSPMAATMQICSRCHDVFWRTQPKETALANADSIPELKNYIKWKNEQIRETRLRSTNEGAAKLWKQYQLLLKLGDDGSDEPPKG